MRIAQFFILGVTCSLTACQENQESNEQSNQVEDSNPENQYQDDPTQEPETSEDPQEDTGEEQDSEEAEEIGVLLPNLLQCASQNMSGQTIRMSLQNIYSQAHTEFTLGNTHHLEGVDIEILDHSIYQSVPILGDSTIDLDFTAEHHISEDGEDFFGGDAQMSW